MTGLTNEMQAPRHGHVEADAKDPLRVELNHAPTLNFAMEQSGVPVVTTVHVENVGPTTVENAVLFIGIEPNIAPRTAHPLPKLRAGESLDLGVLDIRLEPGRLRAIREAERAELTWDVRIGERTVASGHGTIEVLAYNEWAGLRAPPALLATFVTPNDPVIAGVLRRVRDRLRTTTGDNALTGYQRRSPERVRQMVVALYDTIQALGISYTGAPASFEEVGQKVRLADMLLDESMGNCLDVSVLVASCLEQMALAPLLVILKDHALPGVWLVDERFHEGVVYDAARLRNAIALGQLLFFDSSTTVSDPPLPFETAEQIATRILSRDADFRCLVDVPVARRDRYRPLPLRETRLGKTSSPPEGRGSEQARAILLEAAEAQATESHAAARQTPEGGRASAAPQPPNAVVARFKQWRDRLLDLSLRNKLLNFRKETKGALELEIPDIARFEDLLAADETFEVQPRPARDARDERDSKLVVARTDEGGRVKVLAGDLDKGIVHCPFDEPRMLKHAIHLDREARTSREEGGANVLYVAVGLLKWFESDSSTNPRFAPLLLVPIGLEYVRTTRRIRIKRLPEESVPNATLIEKMKADFGVDLASLGNVEADDSGLDVPAMLRGVREAIQRMARWEVLEEAHVGLFSFTKFLMWKDLEENQDVLLQNEVIKHIANKSDKAFPDKSEQIPPERLDDQVPPAHLPLVVDADSTQTAAIVAALGGRNFVLQGPPGTGKSQTITNLIAAALAHGKTILFVSEKMAALDVVYRRLQGVGLGDFCLELHSHKTQKKQVVQSLAGTLDRAEKTKPASWEEKSRDLGEMRATLNAYVRAAHLPRRFGMTFHQASARLLALASVPEVRVSIPNALDITGEQLAKARTLAGAFGTTAAQVEPVSAHTFRECAVDAWTAQRDLETRDALGYARDAARSLGAAQAEFCQSLEISAAISLATLEGLALLGQTVSLGPIAPAWKDDAAWQTLRERVTAFRHAVDDQEERRGDLAGRWNENFIKTELEELAPRFARWATAFFILAWFFLREARKRLKAVAKSTVPGNRQVAADLSVALEIRAAEKTILKAQRTLAEAFDGCGPADSPSEGESMLARGEVLRAATRNSGVTDNQAVERLLRFANPAEPGAGRATLGEQAEKTLKALRSYRAQVEAVGTLLGLAPERFPEDGPGHLTRAVEKLAGWIASMPTYRPWALYRRACREMSEAGLAPIVTAHFEGKLAGAQAEPATERAILTAWTIATRDAEPVLRDFDGKNHHRLVERFREADGKHIGLAQKHVATVVEGRLPRAGTDLGTTSEPGILRREMAKKTRHMPLRKLLQQIPNLLVRLKPCLLMSPLSVAQYLPAKGRRFDIVVFDEASQICTHDAIGAIGRGTQLVVVGDSKQLPPTAFFQKAAAEEDATDDEDLVDLESILDESLAKGLPQQMLGWHYRSRHESLIQFSNEHYYEGRLNVFPAARGRVDDLGVKFHHVADGFYEAGKSRTNPLEARALVAVLVAALQKNSPAERSFGVVTFSMAQQQLVEELLNEARRTYPEIEHHFADAHPNNERVFIKNLENVQGDERDEILFSVAYGPDEHGKMLMNFGPLNRDGGERRLNVAVTRARKQLRLFSSITHDRIDTNRARGRGAAHLKAFLRFAAAESLSSMARGEEPVGDFDSDFERDVYDALRAAGHRVETQVGCGAYRIDLAVVHPDHPGVYAVGIECDGAAYHSGATARDRDRLRQAVLEGLGWRLHRIWSTDWTYDRANEIDRMSATIDQAVREGLTVHATVKEPATPPESVPAPARPEVRPSAVPQLEPVAARTPIEEGPVVPYRRAQLPAVSWDSEQLYQATRTGTVGRLIEEIAIAEAPIHIEELARRVASAFGSPRITSRVRRRVSEVLSGLRGLALIDDVVWSAGVDREAFALARAPAPGDDGRDAEMLPAEEIAVAAGWVLARAFSIPISELLRETARVFGIQRVGPKVEERMKVGVQVLERRGLCTEEGGRAVWKGPAQS